MARMCTKCGEALIGTGRFCASCGAPAPPTELGATLESRRGEPLRERNEPRSEPAAPPTRVSNPGAQAAQAAPAPSSYGPPPPPANPPQAYAGYAQPAPQGYPAPQPVPAPAQGYPAPQPAPQGYPQQYAPAQGYAPVPTPQAPLPPPQQFQQPPLQAPQSPPQAYAQYAPPPPPYGSPFVPGARVLVQWADGNRYPGTVQHVAPGGAQCFIVFPDGQQRWVEIQYLALAR
jgi:hypothetical protein